MFVLDYELVKPIPVVRPRLGELGRERPNKPEIGIVRTITLRRVSLLEKI